LPEPVGETMSAFVPLAMTGQPRAWGEVGEPKTSRNHAATEGEKRSSESLMPRL